MKLSFNKGIVSIIGLMGLSMQARRKQEWTELLWRSNVYNAKFSLKSRLEHGGAIEYTYFIDYNCLRTIVTITAHKAL